MGRKPYFSLKGLTGRLNLIGNLYYISLVMQKNAKIQKKCKNAEGKNIFISPVPFCLFQNASKKQCKKMLNKFQIRKFAKKCRKEYSIIFINYIGPFIKIFENTKKHRGLHIYCI